MEFQNTIAYGTFYAEGGEITLNLGNYTEFDFAPTVGTVKNCHAYSTSNFQIAIEQTGTYFIEFSFTAENGDGKTYYIQPYKNGNTYLPVGQDMSIRFYQQPTEQKYEVSTHGLFNLRRGDYIEWKLFSPASASSLALLTKNIKMNLFNLQQIGLH